MKFFFRSFSTTDPTVESLGKKPVEEPIAESAQNGEDEMVTVSDGNGNVFRIRYVSSFTAKLIRSSDEVKAQYAELKKEILSYEGTSAKTAWHFESIGIKRNLLLRFCVRGKTLCVYYALDPAHFVNSKYKVETAASKKFKGVECLYRIKNARRVLYAKELIAIIAKKFGLTKGRTPDADYYLPYEERDALVARGLIRELKMPVDPE